MYQCNENVEINEYLDPACLSKIYNFAYRLSGNEKIAKNLTEQALFHYRTEQNNQVILLRQVWQKFLNFDQDRKFDEINNVQQALLSLPLECRSAVILRDILAYSYRDIALVLEISEREVSQLISAGRWRMREKLVHHQIIAG